MLISTRIALAVMIVVVPLTVAAGPTTSSATTPTSQPSKAPEIKTVYSTKLADGRELIEHASSIPYDELDRYRASILVLFNGIQPTQAIRHDFLITKGDEQRVIWSYIDNIDPQDDKNCGHSSVTTMCATFYNDRLIFVVSLHGMSTFCYFVQCPKNAVNKDTEAWQELYQNSEITNRVVSADCLSSPSGDAPMLRLRTVGTDGKVARFYTLDTANHRVRWVFDSSEAERGGR